MNTMKIEQLYRYPVKGLNADPLETAHLTPGQTIVGDRAYAIENGVRTFDPRKPKYFPKTHFVMLMKHERLAKLETSYDEATTTLTISRNHAPVAKGDLSTPVGRGIIEQFLGAFLEKDLKGPPRIVSAADHSISDVPIKCLSFVNLASIRDLSRIAGQDLDPIRFRANIYFDNDTPWSERNWLNKTVEIGGAELKIIKATDRCPATNVNPKTAERDLNLPGILRQSLGHIEMGFYATVERQGTIKKGDAIKLET
jgi:uncharacterized protein YcbX